MHVDVSDKDRRNCAEKICFDSRAHLFFKVGELSGAFRSDVWVVPVFVLLFRVIC